MLAFFSPLIAKAGTAQFQQAAPGAKADPFGSFSHFMGATNANILDPLDIFGKSGSNPVKNFLNPAGVTLIKGMVPSNNPLPVGTNGSSGPSANFPLGSQPTGISPSQMGMMGGAFNNYLRAIGQRPMPSTPASPSPGMGGMSPMQMQQLAQLMRGGGGGGMQRFQPQ